MENFESLTFKVNSTVWNYVVFVLFDEKILHEDIVIADNCRFFLVRGFFSIG